MAYTKSPSSATKSPGTITRVPASATKSPATITNVPSGASTFLLDSLSATPSSLYCLSARLRTAYAGNICIVRRASDSAQANIGFVAGTNLVDLAAIAAHCGASNGFVSTWYDQSGNGRNLTQATAALQPKCYDGATGAVLINGRLAATYDVPANADEMTRADSCGISGATAISVWSVWTTAATGAAQPGQFSIGTAAGGQLFEQWGNSSETQLGVSIGGARRNFTVPDVNNQINNTIARLAAGAGIGTARLMHNAAEAAEASTLNPSNTMAMGTTYTDAVGGTHRSVPLNGSLATLAFWGSDLSAGDLAILNASSLLLYGV